MSGPRVEVDLAKVGHNARTLVGALAARGIAVTGVTKATLGSPEVANALVAAGVSGLGDSRIENIEAMRRAGVRAPMTLIRSPMPSQVARVVAAADVSFNTELDVIGGLSRAAGAAGRAHRVVLMVELGDLREGIMPRDLAAVVRRTLRFPHIVLCGIGANLACQSGVVPDDRNMGELSALATSVEAAFGLTVGLVSGGNSGNLPWALGDAAGDAGAAYGDATGADRGRRRVNDLRLGESILLGREPLHRRPLPGLHLDAFTLVAEVIESGPKPSRAWGDTAEAAFGAVPAAEDRGDIPRAILAVGRQDIDPDGLAPPPGIAILGASSDHLVVDGGRRALAVGEEVRFGLDYGALVRAMTSPFVTRVMTHAPPATTDPPAG
jgi:predicted amino acid racemase